MENKRLYRVQSNETQLGGVSIGLAEHFSLDITLIRVIFVILFFTPFPSFITYVILWAALPLKNEQLNAYLEKENADSYQFQTNNFMKNKNNQGGLVAGSILIIMGLIFSFRTYFDINLFYYIGKMWPVFLIGLGVWLIVKEKPRKDDYFDGNTNNNKNEIES